MKPSSSELPTSLVRQRVHPHDVFIDSLEGKGTLGVAAEIHDLLADGRAQSVGGNLLGKVVARHGEDELGLFSGAGHTKDGARKEDTLRLGGGLALEGSGGCGVDLCGCETKAIPGWIRTVLVSTKMVLRRLPSAGGS